MKIKGQQRISSWSTMAVHRLNGRNRLQASSIHLDAQRIEMKRTTTTTSTTNAVNCECIDMQSFVQCTYTIAALALCRLCVCVVVQCISYMIFINGRHAHCTNLYSAFFWSTSKSLQCGRESVWMRECERVYTRTNRNGKENGLLFSRF